MNKTHLIINGNDLNIDIQDANTFKGFGLLSCNNSSRLLIDYRIDNPDSYYKMLQIFFGGNRPLCKMVKVELGDDANTSSGTEPCPKRSSDEPADVLRGAGYQLIADVKKINKKIKTCLLRWGEPGYLRSLWINVKKENPDDEVPIAAFEPMYQLYKQTIIAAYEKFGYIFDYVDPDRNETKHPMYRWIKWFAIRLKEDKMHFPIYQFNKIKIIAADQNYETDFGQKMIEDYQLRQLVSATGYHYNTDDGLNDQYKRLADDYQHEVWYSEGIAPMTMGKYRVKASDGSGIGGKQSALDVANRLIKGYVRSRRTCYIFQPAISAYYPGVNYSHKELINASHPWSGFFEVDNVGLQVMKHFTNFAIVGWASEGAWRFITQACESGVGGTENLDSDTDNPSYVTLMAPEKDEFSTIFVNDGSEPRKYIIKLANLDFNNKTIYIWRSTSNGSDNKNYDDNLMSCRESEMVESNKISLIVYPHSIVTATTLNERYNNEILYRRIESNFENKLLFDDPHNNILYRDEFNSERLNCEVPRYITDQGGAFEIVKDGCQRFLKQMIVEKSRALDWEYSYDPNFTFGDDRWNDYDVGICFAFDLDTIQNTSSGNYLGIGLYEQTDVKGELNSAPYIFKVYTDGLCQLIVNFKVIEEEHINNLSMIEIHEIDFGVQGNSIKAQVDGHNIFNYVDLDSPKHSGRVKVGTGYYRTKIFSIIVKKNSKLIQFSRIDNLSYRIEYHGNWNHVCGLGNTVWNRTLSYGTPSGHNETFFKFNFTGCGFNLIGKQEVNSRLSVMVDDQLIDGWLQPSMSTDKSANVSIQGLSSHDHQVTILVVNGGYILDAVSFFKKDQ
ncbi:glycosyl hydrolase [Oenococcus sp. UCMA 17063]|nr:glycosyl hydrolase [Oenococcus sp. UCMA 17063]